MTTSSEFTVRFWGVRGSIACCSADYARYGGNTSCVEIRCGDHELIFDAGTGIRPLGKQLIRAMPVTANVFFTHTHLDHIVGLPFFAPLYKPGNKIRIWSGHLEAPLTFQDALCHMMAPPLFPVPPAVFASEPEVHDFRAGETLRPVDGVVLKTTPLNHPNGATGYRVEYEGKSVCYVTDCEHNGKGPEPAVVELIKGADVFIYDTSYTDEEYPIFKGWGHSTWQEGVRLADAAGVKTLVLFHHDPSHTDAAMDRIAEAAAAARPGTIAAREGMIIEP
ncbi:MAG TPA: MBL fold metallo-hydrolase [Candidatus Cybelea sp.]|nr:MBL fold metallo-hydrolase [Candidatus Cybelea sp.]